MQQAASILRGRRIHPGVRLEVVPASRRQFLVNGHAPPAGTMFRQPDLARTLRLIADSGPDVFYRGQIADSIVAVP